MASFGAARGVHSTPEGGVSIGGRGDQRGGVGGGVGPRNSTSPGLSPTQRAGLGTQLALGYGSDQIPEGYRGGYNALHDDRVKNADENDIVSGSSLLAGSQGPQLAQRTSDAIDDARNVGNSTWDNIGNALAGFFGFHEDFTVGPPVGPAAPSTDWGFEPLNAPALGIALGFVPGVGPLLSIGYNIASAVYNGNPIQALGAALPIVGSFAGPTAALVSQLAGQGLGIANGVSNLTGNGTLDDMLGTGDIMKDAFSGASTGSFGTAGSSFGGGDNSAGGGDGGGNDFSGTNSSLGAPSAPSADQSLSPQSQASFRTTYGLVSPHQNADNTKAARIGSQRFGGKPVSFGTYRSESR